VAEESLDGSARPASGQIKSATAEPSLFGFRNKIKFLALLTRIGEKLNNN
jgi:hypothetical protein